MEKTNIKYSEASEHEAMLALLLLKKASG